MGQAGAAPSGAACGVAAPAVSPARTTTETTPAVVRIPIFEVTSAGAGVGTTPDRWIALRSPGVCGLRSSAQSSRVPPRIPSRQIHSDRGGYEHHTHIGRLDG